MKLQSVGLLSFGHLATDITQGAVPALLPFFIVTYGLTYTEAAGIVFAANITGSVIQPMFGYLADRWSNGWLMPSGIVLAGLGMGRSPARVLLRRERAAGVGAASAA